MRPAVGVFYWFVVGLLALHALYVSVGESRLWPGLVVPVALALLGAMWPGLGYSGAALIAFGLYPALLITGAVLGQVFSSDWSCSTVAFDGISNPNGGRAVGMSAGCTTVSIDLILFALLLWATALLGAAFAASSAPTQACLRRIHRSAWKGNSANFAFRGFCEVGNPATAAVSCGGSRGSSPSRLPRTTAARNPLCIYLHYDVSGEVGGTDI